MVVYNRLWKLENFFRVYKVDIIVNVIRNNGY